MAYEVRKIVIYGVTGVVIAAIIIMWFWPVSEEVKIKPLVALQEIPAYGIQVIKITDEPMDLIHLYVTIDGLEVKQMDGSWTRIDVLGGRTSLDLLRLQRSSVVADISNLDPGNYTNIRFQIVRGLEHTNATLANGDVIEVDIPSEKIQVMTPTIEVKEKMETILLDLQVQPVGPLANYVILMQHHLTLMTMKFDIVINTKGEALAVTD
jgi:hypothetical protein